MCQKLKKRNFYRIFIYFTKRKFLKFFKNFLVDLLIFLKFYNIKKIFKRYRMIHDVMVLRLLRLSFIQHQQIRLMLNR